MKDEKLKTRQKRRKAENFVFNKGNGEGPCGRRVACDDGIRLVLGEFL